MKNKTRVLIVLLFIALFSCISFVGLRGSYLQFRELGENYIPVFFTNIKYKYIIFGANFVVLYFLMYFTNLNIKKGLKVFFEKENKQMPKFINKSISFVFSVIVSSFMCNILMQKILICSSDAKFGITDPVFNLDISFYMFIKPLIQLSLYYLIGVIVSLTAYMAIYYVVVFNKYFDGVDGKMVKESLLIKKIIRNVVLVLIAVSLLISLKVTDISFNKMLTIKSQSDSANNIEVIGAGYTEVMVQRWGYLIFSFVVLIFGIKAVKAFKKGSTEHVLKNLAIIPSYLVLMFMVIVMFNLVFVSTNIFDKQKEYLENNIKYTKAAYNVDIEEVGLENSGTVTQQDITENESIINNIKIVSSDVVLKTLDDSQTGTGHYSYRSVNVAKYDFDGEYKLVYISPREIKNSGRTYNNKTYEYTHGVGQIVTSATETTETGSVKYIQKNPSGEDDKLGTVQQNIYFGLKTDDTIATNIKNKQEYDYTDDDGNEHLSTYSGNAGLKLNLVDRFILGVTTGDIKLALSTDITKDSQILINRNIIKRVKKAMPYLIYDENPYTVVSDEGKIYWVIDAYTVSSQYPYSQYTSIQHDGIKEKINYIRNSVKVIIDAYDGTMKFYITDKTDPVVMAYRNVYNTLFEDLDAEIPADISEHFVYPEYLYNVQAELLKVYHNVKADVLYRTDDLWNFAKYNSNIIANSSGMYLKPYYTMVKDDGEDELGLIQIYSQDSKQNLISYLVGTTEGANNKLKLYKFSQDGNVFGPMQLDNQIEQDEIIIDQIKSLNTTGTRVTKDMIIVPINNTLLYVEPIYQTMLNEESKIPMLKKVVVASGNKVAIGDNFKQALANLLSKDASSIQVESTDDIYGVIDALVRANKNLTESTQNNDWELIGSDLKKVQGLIDSLGTLKNEEEKKKKADKKENVVEEKNELSENVINELN